VAPRNFPARAGITPEHTNARTVLLGKYLSALLVATAVVAGLWRRNAPQAAPSPNENAGAPQARTKRADPNESGGAREKAPADRSLSGVVLRTWRAFNEDRIMSVGAGATFYILLAIFPGIGALVSLYGLIADASTIGKSLSALAAIVPAGALSIVDEELNRLTGAGAPTLSFAFGFSLLVSLWSANSGMKALFDALNVAYEEKEERSFIVLNATSLLFTFGAVLFLCVTLALLVALPILLGRGGPGAADDPILFGFRYGLLVLGTLIALACLYRFGPDRARPKWQWVSWGSVFTTVFWVAASVGFTWYAANFGSYDKTYGSLGAVVGFMVWLWLSVTIVLVGATLNCEIERRARMQGEDTTNAPSPSGKPEPA